MREKYFLLENIHNWQINFFCFNFDFIKAFSHSGGISMLSLALFFPSPSACALWGGVLQMLYHYKMTNRSEGDMRWRFVVLKTTRLYVKGNMWKEWMREGERESVRKKPKEIWTTRAWRDKMTPWNKFWNMKTTSKKKSLYSSILFLFYLFWCLSFIPQWVIGWFLSSWRKASPAFQNHMNESSWWCACDGEKKCVVEMWLCEKEKRKEERKIFCQKIFSPKRSFGKMKNVLLGRGEVRNHPLHMARTIKMGMICLFSGVICSSHGENDAWQKGKEILLLSCWLWLCLLLWTHRVIFPLSLHRCSSEQSFTIFFWTKKSFSFFRKNEIVVQ